MTPHEEIPMELHRLSLYVPKSKQPQRPLERLARLARERDRSLNHMVIEAILDYLRRAEEAEPASSD